MVDTLSPSPSTTNQGSTSSGLGERILTVRFHEKLLLQGGSVTMGGRHEGHEIQSLLVRKEGPHSGNHTNVSSQFLDQIVHLSSLHLTYQQQVSGYLCIQGVVWWEMDAHPLGSFARVLRSLLTWRRPHLTAPAAIYVNQSSRCE